MLGNVRQNTNYQKRKILPILLLLLTFVSVNQWSRIPIGNITTTWMLAVAIYFCLFYEKHISGIRFFEKPYWIVAVFGVWAIFGIIRGAFIAENYWEVKDLIGNIFILMLPICVYAFNDEKLVADVLRLWLVYALLAYMVFFHWVMGISQFYLGPVYIIACFWTFIPSKFWKIVILILILLLLTYNYQDQRSQMIKALMAILIALFCEYRRFIPNILPKIGFYVLMLLPMVLLYLGLTGEYNLFEKIYEKYEGDNVIERQINGEYTERDFSIDTRTFIYEEVVSSAIKNNYVVFGRTPARGNDTYFFYDYASEKNAVRTTANIKHERIKNELCFPNIFTWLGLVGMFLYMGIYITAAYYGIFRSNSCFIQGAGLMTTFNFAYGWIENCTAFDILNFCYWIFIAMCLSPRFRKMNNEQFLSWYSSIFRRII